MKRPTIKDVATSAGVSRAAVSKVLRGAYGVSGVMRGRVEGAMRSLDYRPQLAARALRGRSYMLGVLLPDIRNPFFADILDGVGNALRGTQYQLLLGVRPLFEATERGLVETMLDRKLDGFIMIAPLLEHAYLARHAASAPTVLIGRHDRDGGFDTVNNDDELGARLAVRHLIAQGHESIGYFDLEPLGDDGAHPNVFRAKGYHAAMRAAGLARQSQVIVGSTSARPEGDAGLIAAWLTSPGRPSAIFAWSDVAALTILSAAQDLGLRVPGDLAIAGYDNSRLCDLAQLSLTSVDQDGPQLGQRAAELLIERIEGRRGEVHFVTPPRLVERRSSGSPEVA